MIGLLLTLWITDTTHNVMTDDRCAIVEFNQVHRDNGDVAFRQVILWEYQPACGHFHVVDWAACHGQWPAVERLSSRCSLFVPTKDLYRVRCSAVRQTWTLTDTELWDRRFVLPENRRRFISRCNGGTP